MFIIWLTFLIQLVIVSGTASDFISQITRTQSYYTCDVDRLLINYRVKNHQSPPHPSSHACPDGWEYLERRSIHNTPTFSNICASMENQEILLSLTDLITLPKISSTATDALLDYGLVLLLIFLYIKLILKKQDRNKFTGIYR